MMKRGKWIGSVTTVLWMLGFWALPVWAMDITDKLSINGLIAGAYQYESLHNARDLSDSGRGAVVFQPEVSIRPTRSDELFAKFGFAAGNGLNGVSPFLLAPWAADLEDDVTDINERDRSYLLTAWYNYTFQFGEAQSLSITGGIIDATDYLDENRYANDGYAQFMNQALVNGPNGFLPSYDIGGALEWEMGKLAVKGAVMDVGENDEGNPYHFYGLQVSYTLETPIGEGTYRLLVDATSKDFSDPDGRGQEALKGIILSFDQALGEILGAWIRFGWSDDRAIVDFKDLYSGGINITGKLWGRETDNIGVGYAYLTGGNPDMDHSQVAEGYARFQLTEVFALTADVQYQKDNYKEGNSPDGFIYGVRLTAEF
jgi:hypothetical protein